MAVVLIQLTGVTRTRTRTSVCDHSRGRPAPVSSHHLLHVTYTPPPPPPPPMPGSTTTDTNSPHLQWTVLVYNFKLFPLIIEKQSHIQIQWTNIKMSTILCKTLFIGPLYWCYKYIGHQPRSDIWPKYQCPQSRDITGTRHLKIIVSVNLFSINIQK